MDLFYVLKSKSGHLLPFSLSRISYGQLRNNKLQQMRRDAFPPNGALNPCYSRDFRCGDNDLNREHMSGKDRFQNTQPKAGHVVSPFFPLPLVIHLHFSGLIFHFHRLHSLFVFADGGAQMVWVCNGKFVQLQTPSVKPRLPN